MERPPIQRSRRRAQHAHCLQFAYPYDFEGARKCAFCYFFATKRENGMPLCDANAADGHFGALYWPPSRAQKQTSRTAQCGRPTRRSMQKSAKVGADKRRALRCHSAHTGKGRAQSKALHRKDVCGKRQPKKSGQNGDKREKKKVRNEKLNGR